MWKGEDTMKLRIKRILIEYGTDTWNEVLEANHGGGAYWDGWIVKDNNTYATTTPTLKKAVNYMIRLFKHDIKTRKLD